MPAAPPDRAPRRAITGRALVLGTVVVLLLVLLAAPLTRYFGSRGDVEHASQQLRSDQSELARLTRQRQLWEDPGYIQAQARQRLLYAMPGDTVYGVTDGRPSDIGPARAARGTGRAEGAWNQRLWETLLNAGS